MSTLTTSSRRRFTGRSLVVVVAILGWWAAEPLQAQIDYRIDYRNTANGRLNDANNRLGSGGRNPRGSAYSQYEYNYGLYANSVITGNVTGLGAFHESTPIPGVNQFRTGLQSDSLASFRARSVGIQQVQRNTAIGSTTYYDPSNWIADVGSIRAGLNQPGSSVLVSPQVQLPTYGEQHLRDKLLGIEDYSTNRERPLRPELDTYDIGRTIQRPIVPNQQLNGDQGLTYPADPYQSAMQSTLFGLPEASREPVPNTQGQRRSDRLNARISTSLSRDELLGLMDKRGATEGAEAGATEEHTPGTLADDSDDLSAPFDSLVRGIGRTDRVIDSTASAGQSAGQDEMFDRMVQAVREIQSSGQVEGFMLHRSEEARKTRDPFSGLVIGNREEAEPQDTTSATEAPSDEFATDTQTETAEDGELPEDMAKPEFDTRAEWAKLFMHTPIRSFALTAQSRFGQNMRAAEEALKNGEFTRSARLFDLAATIDPDSPLPLIGKGNAQIAAGQYVSAVLSLKTGIKQFPQIAAFELDLPTLTGQPDVFDQRRADIESILARHEQYELRFLLGYIELYSGLRFDGLNDLEKAAKNAPADSIIAEFPDMLMGRKPLEPTDR